MWRSLFLLIITSTLIVACSGAPEKDNTRHWSAQRFYSEASAALREGNYETAIKNYEMLEARYPYGKYAAQAQLDIAYAYYKFDEPDAAIDALNRFIRLHPDSKETPYAYYMKGIVNLKRNIGFLSRFFPVDPSQRDPSSFTRALRDFSEVVRLFPNSKYAKDARQRAVFIFNSLAMHEIHIANYYMDRGSYLAAVNRASTVVEKYQRTPAVKQALEIMIKAYEELNLPQLAKDTRRVYEANKGKFAKDVVLDDDQGVFRRLWENIRR